MIKTKLQRPKTLVSYFHAHRKQVSRNLFIFTFLAIPFFNFLIFYLYVNFDSILMAFQRPMYEGGLHFVWGFYNFQTIWNRFTGTEGDILREALINTCLFNFCGIFIGLPLSIIICYFLYKRIKGYRLFRFVLYIPAIITSSALVVMFKYAVGDGGPLEAIMLKLGISYQHPLNSAPSAIITILFYCVVFGFGSNIVVIGGAMNGINPQMLEACRIDGCNWFQEVTHIIVPSIWPTIATILILCAAGFLGASGPILAFTKGDNGTMTLSYYIYALISGRGAEQDLYLASAVGLCMSLVSFPLAMVVKKAIYGKEDK